MIKILMFIFNLKNNANQKHGKILKYCFSKTNSIKIIAQEFLQALNKIE